MFREHLQKNQYAPVEISISYEEFSAAANLFLKFLENIPDEEKRKIHFKSPYHRGTASGYNDKRNLQQNSKDPKEFVHYYPEILKYPAFKECCEGYTEAQEFFSAAAKIYAETEKVAVKLFQTEFPQFADRCIIDNKIPNAHLRFLCYTPMPNIDFNAKGHYDKGLGTLALAESGPGLRIGCCNEHSLQEVRHRNGSALFLPADLMFHASKGTIVPAWHDVVVKPGTKSVSERCERWAIVFFINDKEGKYSEWDVVHKPFNVHKN